MQRLYAPYWIAEDGWHSEVHLRNNLPDKPLTVNPILHAASGEVIALDSVTVPGNQVKVLDLNQALTSAQSKGPGIVVAHRYGYLELQYTTYDLRNLLAPMMLHLIGQPIEFHIDPKPAAENSASGIFDGFWWNRHAGLKDVLILTNRGAKPNPTRLLLSDAAGNQVTRDYALAPNSTVRLSVLDIVRGAGLQGDFGSIHLVPADFGSFDSIHFVYDTSNGFSALMKMFARIPGKDFRKKRAWSRDEGWTLWAPILALASPDPSLRLPSGTDLKPYVFLENLALRPTTVQVRLYWRSREKNGKTAPLTLSLTPNAPQKLDVMAAFNDLPRQANWATVSILTDSGADEVIAVAASYDDSGRYGAQTSFSDQLSGHWEGALWQVDSTHNTLITVGNGGRKATRAELTFRYQTEAGPQTYVIEQPLGRDEQLFLDLADLIRTQRPDSKGRTFSPSATTGSYTLKDLDDFGLGNLFEGKVVTDKRFGHATYGCMVCCGLRPRGLSPNPLSLTVGGTGYFTASAYNMCSHSVEDITDYYDTWASYNTSIATAQWAQATGVGAGSAEIGATGTLPFPYTTEYSPDGCETQELEDDAQVNVKPTISGPNTVWWFNGQTVSGYATSTTLTASAGGANVTWSIYAGSDKVSLTPNGNQATVTSTGTVWSSAPGDVKITATAGGQTSDQFALTTRKPYQLAFPQTQPNCKAGFGYESVISYAIQDQLQTTVPSAVPWNEKFTSSCVQDNSNGNWCSYGLPPETGDTLTQLLDYISGPGTGNNPAPVPTPVCTGDSTQQQHWSQEFRVGSLTSGSGVRVQTDTLVRFTNHAEHQNIVSPAP